MNAKEYSDQFPFDGDVQSGFVIMSVTDLIQVMEEYANHYHQAQVKNNVALGSVRKSLPDGDDIWCKASEMSRDNFADWYDNL
tara:strand:+ start:43 stop:291 length:249 start_codon:yes stop_codon:yes gene_type:complete